MLKFSLLGRGQSPLPDTTAICDYMISGTHWNALHGNFQCISIAYR